MSSALELYDLSETMREALAHVMAPEPASIHEQDREPEAWARGIPKRTCEALRRRGLVDDYYPDSIGGFRAHLTESGAIIRSELVALEQAEREYAAETRRQALGLGLVPPEIARHYRRNP